MTVVEAEKLVDEYVTTISYRNVVGINDAFKIVRQIVNEMQSEIDKLSIENYKYEAKIYAYEAILQNSNFKMAVIKAKKEE